jgi:hypothetical protein
LYYPTLTLPLPRGGNPILDLIFLPSPYQGEGLGVRSAMQVAIFLVSCLAIIS